MYKRPILVYSIRKRKRPGEFSISGPNDFELAFETLVDNINNNKIYLPYCYDFRAERIYYTELEDMDSVAKATFVYQGQYHNSKRILTVPIEREIEFRDEAFPVQGAGRPTLIFSIGRCGSTLISSLLKNLGLRTISEPDIFTQLAILPKRLSGLVEKRLVDEIMLASMQSFVDVYGNKCVIKLRSQCNRIVADFLRVMPHAKYVFVLRERRPWCKSKNLAFGATPKALANKLRNGLVAYDMLQKSGADVRLLWYEDLVSNPVEALTSAGLLSSQLQTSVNDILAMAINTDSQEGTGISREILGKKSISSDFYAQCDSHWNHVKPFEIIDRYKLYRLEGKS